MKFNNKALYALIAIGILMPTASVQAWPWKWGGATPLIQKTHEEVKKEAAHAVTDYAVASAKVVGNATGTLAVNAVKEIAGYAGAAVSKAAERPLLTTAVVVSGIWAYRNWDKVKEAYEHGKKIAKIAAPLAGTLVAGKVTLDAYNAYKSLFGSQEASAQNSAQNPELPKVVQPAVPQPLLNAQEVQDLNELWEETQEKYADEVRKTEAENRLTRAQERVKHLNQQEVNSFNAAWSADKPAVKSEAAGTQLSNAQRIKRSEAVHVNDGQGLLDQEAARKYAADFVRSDEHPLTELIAAQAPIASGQKHEWVEEFKELENAEQAKIPQSKWVKEFNAQEVALKRAVIIARQLTDSADSNSDTASVESHEDNRALSHFKDLASVSNYLRDQNQRYCL